MPLNENVSMPMETTYPKIMREPNPTVPFLSWNGYHNGQNIQTPNGKPVYTDNIVKLYHFRKDWEEILAVIARTVKEDIATKENSIVTQMNELDYKIKKAVQ